MCILELSIGGSTFSNDNYPERGAEDLRTRIELLGIGGAIIWGWLAIWARKRRAISQTVALRSIGQALVLLSVIYSLGIVLGFLS